MTNWTGDDGWPVEFPEKLVNAFRKIPNGENLTNDKIHRMAKIIGVIAEGGEIEELPRNRTASVDGSEGELRKFQYYCKRLADQIETLRRPSVLALSDEGVAVFDLYENLRQAEETAQYASGRLETSSKGGRPKKIQAASVTSICAKLFEEISGRHPTFTTDPHTSLISGDWPAFLETVFEALYIDASVASQVRAISQKTI
ncbi:MAG: hypothetical protein ACI9ON_004372 [Limisphaerales bacterium]|jgi:hypothetical protein